jgi:threonine aldolase
VSQHPRGFASDNFAGAHPEVVAAIADANEGHVPAYGEDPFTAAAEARLREHFGDEARSFLVFNGSAANVLSLLTPRHRVDAAICPETAHLNVDECGAPERIGGVKLLTVTCPDGKLTPELLAGRMRRVRIGDQHAAQPRVVSISNASELGTVYTPDEVAALAELAHEHEMLLHVDGARLANAAASLDVSLRALTTDAGADVVSFGGTKNGLLFGEAVVFIATELAEDFAYVRKQSLQLASKMRFVGAQFDALLRDGLWLRSAAHANAMASRLAHVVKELDGICVTQLVESNAVFATLPRGAREHLQAAWPGEQPFHVWNEEAGEVRWMTSWDTTEDDVDRFAAAVAEALEKCRE